ncbi:ATP-grasp domain-containing protein [Candidatus Kaiserbacteria bacterium]|nr:MAG: ATP-grasp domain-containing protein [Candidatus Kaiserbacteria bacterium]
MDEEYKIRKWLYEKACTDIGLTLKVLDGEQSLVRVSKRKDFFVTPFYDWPPLNTSVACDIAKDKVLTKELLSKSGIKTPEGRHFFVANKNDWVPDHNLKEDAYLYAEGLGYPIVVKPHNLSRGQGVEVCYSREQLTKALEEIQKLSHVAMVEEVIVGREGRLFCIGDEIQFMYYKESDADTQVGNLAVGGKLVGFEDKKIPEKLSNLAKVVFDSFGHDLRLFAIDFFEQESGDCILIEVNGKPFLSSICKYGYQDTALRVLVKSLEKYFKKSKI